MPVTPNVLRTVTTWLRTASAVMLAAGGANVPPVKLLAVTPRLAATMLVNGVTPIDAEVPPTLGTTAKSDCAAPKSLSVPSRSSRYFTPGPPVTLTVPTPVKVAGTLTTATPREVLPVPSPVTLEPNSWPLAVLYTLTLAPPEKPPSAGLTESGTVGVELPLPPHEIKVAMDSSKAAGTAILRSTLEMGINVLSTHRWVLELF